MKLNKPAPIHPDDTIAETSRECIGSTGPNVEMCDECGHAEELHRIPNKCSTCEVCTQINEN